MNREEIIEMARQAQSVYGTDTWTFALCANQLEAFAKLIAEKEREACAVICDEFPDAGHIGKRLTTNYHSYLIRNRGQA